MDDFRFMYERHKNTLAIARALVRTMSAQEIVEHFDVTFVQYWKIRIELLACLHALCKKDSSNVQFGRQLFRFLISNESLVPSSKRRALDKTLSGLISYLSLGEQLDLVYTFIESRRASRRRVAFQVMARCVLPEHKSMAIQCFECYHRQQALEWMTRAVVDIVDVASFLLDNLESPYERARVFERLMIQDYDLAVELAPSDPLAFAWGAGRAECCQAVPVVLRFFDVLAEEEKGLIIWALGKLHAKGEVERLAQLYGVDILHFSTGL